MPESHYTYEYYEEPIPSKGNLVIQLESEYVSKGGIIIHKPNNSSASEETGYIYAIGYGAFDQDQPGLFTIGDKVQMKRYATEVFQRKRENCEEMDRFCFVVPDDILCKIADKKKIVSQGETLPEGIEPIEINEAGESKCPSKSETN